jgi:hypothetical protein
LETFEIADLHVAIKNALRMGAIGFDAVNPTSTVKSLNS